MINIIHTQLKFKNHLNDSFRRSLSLFYSRIYDSSTHRHQFISEYDIDTLLNKVSSLEDIDWCVVHGEGTIYLDQYTASSLYRQHIESLPTQTLVTGHLIDKHNCYCGIHEQSFAVNIREYLRLGKPEFGSASHKLRLLNDYHADQSYHDGYTPKKITPADSRSGYESQATGWNMVNQSLTLGVPVHNLSEKLRNSKLYIYPENDTEILNKGLQAIFDLEVPKELQQRRLFSYMIHRKLGLKAAPTDRAEFYCKKRSMKVFVYNTEYLVPNHKWFAENKFSFSHYIGPASGLLDIANMAFAMDSNFSKLTYFDINAQALEYKKFFWDQIEGYEIKDIIGVISNFREQYPQILIEDRSMERCLFHLQNCLKVSKYNLKEVIHKGKEAKKTFRCIDLLNEAHLLINDIFINENTFLSISDIFLGQNELFYGFDNMSQKFINFLKALSQFDRLALQGKNMIDDSFFIGLPEDLYSEQLKRSSKLTDSSMSPLL